MFILKRNVFFTFLFALTVTQSGCFFTVMSAANSKHFVTKETKAKETVVFEDDIIAVGEAASTSSILPKNSLILLGEKNSYAIENGSSILKTFITKLSGWVTVNNGHPIKLVIENEEHTFHGKLVLNYYSQGSDYSEYELRILNGFKDKVKIAGFAWNREKSGLSVVSNTTINVAGKIFPPVKDISNIKTKLKHPRRVTFITKGETKRVFSPVQAAGAVTVLLPIVVGMDVVTLPLQAAFLGSSMAK